MAVDDVRDVLGRPGPGGPIDPAVIQGIAGPAVLREVRDEVLDICDDVTLEGAEDEDLSGELINEGDLVALVDVAGRFCGERPDVACAADVDGDDLGRYGATYQALGHVEHAAGPLQLAAHTAVLLLSADLTRKNDEIRARVDRAGADAKDLTARRVLDALFGNEDGLRSGLAASAGDRRARVRLLDQQGARAVGEAVQAAAFAQAEARGATLRGATLPPLQAPKVTARRPGAAKDVAKGKKEGRP